MRIEWLTVEQAGLFDLAVKLAAEHSYRKKDKVYGRWIGVRNRKMGRLLRGKESLLARIGGSRLPFFLRKGSKEGLLSDWIMMQELSPGRASKVVMRILEDELEASNYNVGS